MYYDPSNQRGVEEICYEDEHIETVLAEIKKNLPNYFQQYINTNGGTSIQNDDLKKLAEKFGATENPKSKKSNPSADLKHLEEEAINQFETDREDYIEILDVDALAEYAMDVPSFKNKVLHDQVPIIRKTLQNKSAKELDKYRKAFRLAQASDLYRAVNNIILKAHEWLPYYSENGFDNLAKVKDLQYHDLDKEDYVVYSVIGGGIKSHFIYKLHPHVFPYRSRNAVWALWYLSNKLPFGCKEDSEFLMINREEGTTQQNYFYPYGLFSYYAIKISIELEKLYSNLSVILNKQYRFVAVEDFLSFVAKKHQTEIDELKKGYENDF